MMGTLIFLLPMGIMAQQGMHFQNKMESLDLTSEQQSQLEKLHTDMQKGMIQLKANLQIAQLELKTALNSGASDKEVTIKADALTKAQNAMVKARVDHQLKVRSLLGPDKFGVWMKSHRGQMMHRRNGECGFQGRGGMRAPRGMRPGMGPKMMGPEN